MVVNANLDFTDYLGKRYFSFQLEKDNKAVAVIDIEDGRIVREILTGSLKNRREAVERLAVIYYKKNKKEGLTANYSRVR